MKRNYWSMTAIAAALALCMAGCAPSASINALVNASLAQNGSAYTVSSISTADDSVVSLIKEAAAAYANYSNSLENTADLQADLEDAEESPSVIANEVRGAKERNLKTQANFAKSIASFEARGIGKAYRITSEDVPAGLENEQAVARYVASLLTGDAQIYVSDIIGVPSLDDSEGTYTGNKTYMRYAYIEYTGASASAVTFSNSYDNTAELLEKFPVLNPTPVTTQMEKNIQNRLLNGFNNYNLGYDAWKAWGDILYTEDSLYNVHGVHMTLGEYQQSQNVGLKAADIQMGSFNNMLICGDWCAIRYDITSTNRQTGETTPGSVMEFVNFKDYGDGLGTRVVEGWAGTKGADFGSMSYFQTDAEKAAQAEALAAVADYEIPNTENLEEKYPVLHPTANNSEWEAEIKAAILQDFDKWNQGADVWSEWAQSYYADDYISYADTGNLAKSDYIASVQQTAQTTKTTRLYFDNMLISGDWAAIHYRVTKTNVSTGEIEAGDTMQFLHFAKDGDGVKVVESWTK